MRPSDTPVGMSWTQAICNDCWDKREPDRPSPRSNQGGGEFCAYCGDATVSGIYVRDDPANVKFPQPKD